MAVIIQNISGADFGFEKINTYEVLINTKHIAFFKHWRKDGLAVCLRKAAEAVDLEEINKVDRPYIYADKVPLKILRLPTRIRNALLKDNPDLTVGDIRGMTDKELMSFPNIGKGSVQLLRELGK